MILKRVDMKSEKAKHYGKIVKVEDFAKEFGINMDLDLRELFRQRGLALIEENKWVHKKGWGVRRKSRGGEDFINTHYSDKW